MDQEQSQFFFENCGFDQQEGQKIVDVESPVLQPQNQQPLTLKAFNPFEYVEHLPQKEQQKYLNMMMHNKTYPGITHFINFDKPIESPQFLSSIESQSESQKDWTDNPLHLDYLFTNNPQTMKRKMEEINLKVNQISTKTFQSLNINHLINPHFAENFDNFLYLNSHLNFIKDLEVSMMNFADQVKQREQKYDLVVKIYEFWMSTFQLFVQNIKKHNERYTLSMVKKLKDGEGSNQSNYEGRSTTSSKIMDIQKRKAWKASQLEMLEKVIQSNSAFNQITINKIAEQLNRTPASVSSKIQKIIKDQKVSNPDYEVHENMTLLQKIVNVLKNYPEGLSRESVIERVNEHYEMGYDMSWSKSVAQILSSKPQFVRVKGTFSLNGQFTFDMDKKTFKDKVVNCLLAIPEGKADLKRLVDQYISLYGTTQGITILSDERRKTIQASISKSLCRYDIFDKSKSKTVYKLREFIDENDCEMEIEGYLA